jgi:hypothetical protein
MARGHEKSYVGREECLPKGGGMRHRRVVMWAFVWPFGSLGVLGVGGPIALGAPTAGAQEGSVRGVVNDSAGKPIADADVSIVALHKLTRTDDQGRFSLSQLPKGEVELSVRRLGYQPQTVKAAVTDAVTYSFTVSLVAQPAVLAAVAVDASEQRLRLGIEDFYRRRARGVGTYFTREEIMNRGARATSEVFRSTPGIRYVRTNSGQGIRFTSAQSLRNRNGCIPLIWIDGQHAEGMEVDEIPVNDIEGIELYRGPATTPSQFWQGNLTECGTVVIWSRMPPR